MFLLIEKLEQFCMTIHYRHMDVVEAPLTVAARDGKSQQIFSLRAREIVF